MPDPARMGPVLFVAVGAIFTLIGLYQLCTQIGFHRRAVRCRGVVVDFRTRWRRGSNSGPGRTMYYPILEFRTADGQDVRTEGRIGKNWRGFRPGEPVTVTYDPRDPSHAYPGTGAAATVLALFLTAFGGLFVTIGMIVLMVRGLPGVA